MTVKTNGKKGVTLGILGGMGPESSMLFYNMVIRYTKACNDQDHIDMIIYNHATIPDRTSMIKEGKIDDLAKILVKDAKALESFGADCLIITCNTSHIVADVIQAAIGIPIINMIREAVAECAAFYAERPAKIAVLATDGTINSGLYQRELKMTGLEPYVPSAENQKLVMKLIYDVKCGGEIDISDFDPLEKELQNSGCCAAIAGCTELSVLKERFGLSEFYRDAMLVLVRRAIAFAGKDYEIGVL